MPALRLSIAFLAFFIVFQSITGVAAARQPIPADSRPSYRRAFEALEDGQPQLAKTLLNRGGDRVLNKVLEGYLMALPGNAYSFDELAAFIADNPDWYGLNGIRMIAEQKIPSSASAQQIVNWFEAYPPLTAAGFYRYTDALAGTGQTAKMAAQIRDRWINKDFSAEENAAFQARFGHMLTRQDHIRRLDRLLWDGQETAARAMYPLTGAGYQALAQARFAFASSSPKAKALLQNVPERLQNNPGLLYERLRWLRKNNEDRAAIQILMRAPVELGRADAWWDERHILIRRLTEQHDFRTAYKLAADHGLNADSSFDYMEAEFLAGWLALRFLNRADIAQDHFKNLLGAASTPISRARGAYWLGRAMEALNDKQAAEQAYETAAALQTTYYGQLALTRLYAHPVITAAPEPAIPSSLRQDFFARDSVLATERLLRIGQTDKARAFFRTLSNSANQRVEFALLVELAYQMRRPDWAIQAAKAANQKNMILGAGAYPVLSLAMPDQPDPAFTHALIRQESLFNCDALSPAGAKGLMQLLPSTAKGVAKKLGLRYRESQLLDPGYNLRLGAAFAQEQLNRFDGSYLLALAGYNAGPSRVREWLQLFGDPRTGQTDPIDWIEAMTIYETRNYVQRIMENLQIYRARLNGGQAPLMILEDLKR